MKYQLRYAICEIPESMEISEDFGYSIRDKEKSIILDMDIGILADNNVQEFLDEKTEYLKSQSKIVKIYKNKYCVINGNNAHIVHIDYKDGKEYSYEYNEYVFITHGSQTVVFSAWGFLAYFENARSVWESMYKSFRTDGQNSYKLPFGSFTLPKGASDYSQIAFVPKEEGYDITIEYADDHTEAKEKIRDFKPTIVSLCLGAKIKVRQDKTLIIDNKKGHYVESQVSADDEKVVFGFFQIFDGIKPGLDITIGGQNVEIFEQYRPHMETFLKSITFD